ncbi:hypothetical protein GUITHDRAFT_144657 [Guillardia theta CCMP2712]|uniref:Uncharacterized protein n=1 Tax=Guillardia theta (strain CCMP2712) TaxID=905079 RepID=L1IP46_GUITC|nr:hypothetical protein GUITHDRAFT_144656 [Guillardia theta CCMP2712]XP_005824802.1 hypothetical protein GUITHDRAFT_144657 [Guillardia theta CCMP2712]EKX37821.1 hypothetical protein GUITHDRAFT_144656 [Guillardia theta CCMP2712]EKX37822.1 hypothetical protein GUITHDRAFT_144657 [Guillardia theta CCMP2712]|eukprot:XP_005824801.1 hypothetical protein GUITHDRAFT_144656 [Guillardia theta CCMP2712]
MEMSVYEVWVCLENHPCALHPVDTYFCWVFNEMTQSWVPFGENVDLKLVHVIPRPSECVGYVNISHCAVNISMTADNAFELFVNGVYLGYEDNCNFCHTWKSQYLVYDYTVNIDVIDGEREMVVAAKIIDWPGGLTGLIGTFGGVPTSASANWKCATFPGDVPPRGWTARSFNDSQWSQAVQTFPDSRFLQRPLDKQASWIASPTYNLRYFCRGVIKNPEAVCTQNVKQKVQPYEIQLNDLV